MSSQRSLLSVSRKSLGLLLVALLLLGGGVWWLLRSRLQARRAAETQETIVLPQRVQVAALGRVEPVGRVVDVVASEAGRLARLLVREGDRVQANQILGYLDIYKVREAERDLAASELAAAESLLAAQTNAGEAGIQEAQTRVDQIDQPQLAAIAAQQNAIDSLQAKLDIAQADLVRLEQLYAEGAISLQALDRQRATAKQLQEDVLSAEARKQELEVARDRGMSNAIAQVETQRANLGLAQARIAVNSATQNLALAEARLDQAIIRAPKTGQVLKLNAEPGEAITASQPILSLGDTTQMYVVAEVYETDVSLVKPGQRATITSRNGAFAETLTGSVEQVGLQIFKNDVLDDDPAANADARVVEVRIRVDQSALLAGLTNLQVDVAIALEPTSL
jgi:HlyD family secretion protein